MTTLFSQRRDGNMEEKRRSTSRMLHGLWWLHVRSAEAVELAAGGAEQAAPPSGFFEQKRALLAGWP